MRLGKGPLKLIKISEEAARARMHAKQMLESTGKTLNRAYMAVFHRHDFTEEKLALIEGIARSFTNSPLVDLFNEWSKHFIAWAFFGWLHISFFSGVVNGVNDLLDGAINSGVAAIRKRFQQAWEADARCGKTIASSREYLDSAQQKIGSMMQRCR